MYLPANLCENKSTEYNNIKILVGQFSTCRIQNKEDVGHITSAISFPFKGYKLL